MLEMKLYRRYVKTVMRIPYDRTVTKSVCMGIIDRSFKVSPEKINCVGSIIIV